MTRDGIDLAIASAVIVINLLLLLRSKKRATWLGIILQIPGPVLLIGSVIWSDFFASYLRGVAELFTASGPGALWLTLKDFTDPNFDMKVPEVKIPPDRDAPR